METEAEEVEQSYVTLRFWPTRKGIKRGSQRRNRWQRGFLRRLAHAKVICLTVCAVAGSLAASTKR
jgi:hypothetical protein